MEEKVVSRKKQLTIVVTSNDFKDGEDFVELHTIPQWFKVIQEGPAMYFFKNKNEETQEQEEVSIPIPKGIVKEFQQLQHLQKTISKI